jgi:hypothetical protein
LAGGDIKSFPLSLAPLTDTGPVGGSHTVTAQLLDGTTRLPVRGAKIGFKVVSGPNAGATGSCSPFVLLCTTDPSGQVSFTYNSNGNIGADTIAAFYDINGNGSADPGEPQTTAGMTWTKALVACTYGAWPYDGASLTRYYSYGGGHRYFGNIFQGAANWSNTGTKVHIQQWPGVPYAVHIPVGDVNGRQTWWGQTTIYTKGSIIVSTSLSLNQRTMDPLGDFMRTKVSTHELGHALGLEHPEQCGTSFAIPSVMHQGVVSYNTPQTYDKNIISRLYP